MRVANPSLVRPNSELPMRMGRVLVDLVYRNFPYYSGLWCVLVMARNGKHENSVSRFPHALE